MGDEDEFKWARDYQNSQQSGNKRPDPMKPNYEKYSSQTQVSRPMRLVPKFYEPGNSDYDRQHNQPSAPIDHELFMFSRQLAKETEKKDGKLYNLVMTSPAFQELKAQTKTKFMRGGGKNLMEDHAKQMLVLAKQLGWKLES